MSLWGSLTSGIKPKYYANASFVTAVNVATEQANHSIPHAGWVVQQTNTTTLTITITAGGTGYGPGDTLTFTGGSPVNASNAYVFVANVNGNGAITALTVQVVPVYSSNVVPTIGVTTTGGTGAVLTGAFMNAGRVGRMFREVLVAGSFDDTTAGVG
jgi:hypothetical protein